MSVAHPKITPNMPMIKREVVKAGIIHIGNVIHHHDITNIPSIFRIKTVIIKPIMTAPASIESFMLIQ